MTPTIVPIYAAILALVFVALSIRVIGERRRSSIGIGFLGSISLERRVRVQGNFAEYVPITLILLMFIEMQGWAHWVVHLLGVTLVAARIVHAYGVGREPEDFRIRVTGMAGTFTVLIGAALLLLMDSIL